ncbi:hypothetical protein MB46_14650 [Arthrobacter alpinus]|uniref:LytR C-terminal domain-containing protein n=1 Tax=Arthrobacter alpinus TaxID=656366 RepID=UPI000679C1EF|nr:LytR C-terminal domain-containing protein [Arthrobacter alpinus]ALV46549.1 hypothetical protein MB46_14650 [Arthrobacter alpinus]
MTSPPAGPPSGTPAKKNDGANPTTEGGAPSTSGTADAVALSAGQRRRAARDERRQAKDALYELRRARKKAKDGTSLRGHHIVNAQGLAEAFPPPETPEFEPVTVRRRILHGAILVLLLAMLVAALVLASMVQRGEIELKVGKWEPLSAPVSCPSETLDYAPNASVTVNVFNGGSTEGKAGVVAEELTKRGFLVKDVANTTTDYSAPAVVISGATGHSAAYTLQKNFPDTDYVQDDRQDATVDVIITANYSALVAVPKVDTNPGVLSCPGLSPAPSTPAVSAPAVP